MGPKYTGLFNEKGKLVYKFHKKDVVAFIGRLKYEFRPKYIHNKLDGDKDCYIEWNYLNKQRYSKIQYDSDGEEASPHEAFFARAKPVD